MTKDGVLMVMHDPQLDTTTDVAKKFPDRHRDDGVKYYAVDFTLPEIETLTVTERFDPKTGRLSSPIVSRQTAASGSGCLNLRTS